MVRRSVIGGVATAAIALATLTGCSGDLTGNSGASGSNAPSAAQGSGENGANGQGGASGAAGASGENNANGANGVPAGPLDPAAFQTHLDQLTGSAPLDFAAYSKDLSPESVKTVDQIAQMMTASPAIKLDVEGHANGQFVNQEQSQTLSQQRAEAIATELENKGVAKDRITAKGAGNGTGDEAGARRATVKVQA